MKCSAFPFSPAWQVFFEDLPAVDAVPAGGRTIDAPGGYLDLAALRDYKFSERQPATAFNRFTHDKAETVKLFFETDYWIIAYINGQLLVDTVHQIESPEPCRTVSVPLRRGNNLLAVKVYAGSNGWNMLIGSSTKNFPVMKKQIASAFSSREPSLVERYRRDWKENGYAELFNAEIARHRQGNAQIRIIDRSGRPVIGEQIEIRQVRHYFLFGCNCFPLGQLGEEKNARYEELFSSIFNLATAAFCWKDIEPEPGKFRFAEDSPDIWRRPPPDRVVKFGRKYGLALKGQPFVAAWQPAWAASGDIPALKNQYLNFIRHVAARYRDDFLIWDVENEGLMPNRRQPDSPLFTPGFEYITWAFKEAAKLFPADVFLEINEGTPVNGDLCEEYFRLIRKIRAEQGDIRSVGIQFHMFGECALGNHLQDHYLGIGQLRRNYARLCELGLPLFISEVTVPGIMFGGCAGEEIQAEVLENLYRLWFSIPHMRGIVYWNLNDGAAWGNEGKAMGGLTDAELIPKASWHALRRLINREWRTDIKAETDSSGNIDFRGYYGKYEIYFSGNKETFDLIPNTPANFTFVRPGTL